MRTGSIRAWAVAAAIAAIVLQGCASDAAAARSVVDRYEAASVAGDAATAWSLLAPESQRMFPAEADFADMLRRGLAAGGGVYVVGEARSDDPSVAAWLAKSAPGVSDPGRVFTITVTHPNASAPAGRRESFYVALDTAGAWRIWFD